MVLQLVMRRATERRISSSRLGTKAQTRISIMDTTMVGREVRGGVVAAAAELRGQVRDLVPALALGRAGMRVRALGGQVGGECGQNV